MAGDWIKIEHTLPNKPEVMEMSDVLGIPDDEVVGLLVRFWSWVDANLSPECPVVYGTTERIGRLVSCAKFPDAMCAVGWLTIENGKLAIPNYDHHLSQSAKRRGVESKKKKWQRQKMSLATGDKCPHETGTREEKRREEKIKVKKHTKKAPEYSPAFEAWWALYPRVRRVGKQQAAVAYKRAVARLHQHADPHAYLLERLELFAASAWAKSKYCWGPTPWLNQGHYDDDPAAWERSDGEAKPFSVADLRLDEDD